jgi:hypothetical protein
VKELAAIPPAAVAEEVAKRPEVPPPAAVSVDVDRESEDPDPDEPLLPAAEETSPEKRAEAGAVRREAAEARRVLEALGYGRREARERAVKALALLANLGRAPTAKEILNTAIKGRAVVARVKKSASADGGRSGAAGADPRGEPRPPEDGDEDVGPEGGSRADS